MTGVQTCALPISGNHGCDSLGSSCSGFVYLNAFLTRVDIHAESPRNMNGLRADKKTLQVACYELQAVESVEGNSDRRHVSGGYVSSTSTRRVRQGEPVFRSDNL